jgi:tRNA(Ile)-lysidine synthase
MPRSHPPALLKLVARALRDECGVTRRDRILVAVSGGGDSMALLHCLALLRRSSAGTGWSLVAHGVDHGLRGEAGQELDLAQRLAESVGVEFSRSRVDVDPGGNLQARARRLRLDALSAAAERLGASLVATGHHADDRAETVVMRLLRGAGPRGLSVLAPRAGQLIRPLIRARRADVQAHLGRHRITFADDPSNDDRRFLRVRVRREVMPLLELLSPQIVGHLSALADQLAQGATPTLLAPDGQVLELSRRHIEQIARAQRLRQYEARIRLPGGRLVRIDRRTGSPALV